MRQVCWWEMMVKIMKRVIPVTIVSLCAVFAASCAMQQTHLHAQATGRGDVFYAAVLINGQVYLQLNANQDAAGRIGPFVKTSEGAYICEAENNEGTHSLYRSSNGEWLYSWSYIHMRAVRVDATALIKGEQQARLYLEYLL
jgi:hypothetical protein